MKKRGIALKKGDHLDHDGNDHNDDGNDVVDDKLNFFGICTASEASTLQNYVVKIKW